MKIITDYVYPPIPDRSNDWAAYYDGREESGLCGWGKTEADAIRDLVENYDVPDVAEREAETTRWKGAWENCQQAAKACLAEVDRLRAVLDQCAAQFQFYADEHAKAGKSDKAATNQKFADLARAALRIEAGSAIPRVAYPRAG